jgi:dihydrofolate reductase
MSMSLDGFIAGRNEGRGNGFGDGGHRLHEWSPTGAEDDRKAISGRLAGVNGQVVDEFMATGAVVAGRGTFEPAGGWGGDHHDGVPIFVLSRREPDSEMGQWPLVTYVNDVRTAMSEAKRAAGDKNVLVHGAATAQLALAAGVLDELEIHLIPVLLAKRAVSSPTSVPSTSSSSAPGSSRGTVSPTCTTASSAEVSVPSPGN